ncbi:MAG: DUF3772 domain-containing protein [Paracoccaceae bacterium]
MRRVLAAALLVLALIFAAGPLTVYLTEPALAQEAEVPVDYAIWEREAKAAEEALKSAKASNKAFEELRAKIVEWRQSFDAARAVNAPQIEVVQAQIADLGPVPGEGASEAPEIAAKRKELSATLSRLQAPGVEAVAAYRRADGIVKQIDKLIRDRQAKELLRLMPTPLNPLHWPSAGAVLEQGGKTLWSEIDANWSSDARRTDLRNNLLGIFISLGVAVLLMLRGPGFMERLSRRLQDRTAMRMRHVVAAVVSLGQVIVPVFGMMLVHLAITISGMAGSRLLALAEALPVAAFSFFAARWLASWLFPDERRAHGPNLTDRPAEARFHVQMIGLLQAIEEFRIAFTTEVRPPLSQAAQAVWLTPLVLIVALFLFRLGQLLRRQRLAGAEEGDAVLFRNRMIGLCGTVMVAAAAIAPLLAVVGYVTAANALIWPVVGSAALIGAIILLQRFLTDIYVAVTRTGEEGREALIPVLTGFLLAVASLPLFALTWGARPADLSEVWARIQAGVTLGGARISPTAILTLFVVFVIGYMITRLVQGALRSSILPRTKLDKGAQNAAVSGLGYVGIFLSALAAITTAGIDLSALAIVAGALSVGIGFGLQNIVQNFVSGIILLIERPISEGDMIEVNGQFGIVKGISVRSTWIETFDHTDVIVPNGDLVSGIVTNLTRGNLTGRLILPVGVAYGSDTRKVQALLRDIVEAQPLVLVNPAPKVQFVGLGADSLNFEVRAILSDVNFKLDVQTELLHQIVERFTAEGIEIPFAQRDIWIRNPLRIERAETTPPGASGKKKPAKPAASAPVEPKAATPDPIPPEAINYDPRVDEREDEE